MFYGPPSVASIARKRASGQGQRTKIHSALRVTDPDKMKYETYGDDIRAQDMGRRTFTLAKKQVYNSMFADINLKNFKTISFDKRIKQVNLMLQMFQKKQEELMASSNTARRDYVLKNTEVQKSMENGALQVGIECPVEWPGCCWHTALHYLLEDVNHLHNVMKKYDETSGARFEAEVQALRQKVAEMEERNHSNMCYLSIEEKRTLEEEFDRAHRNLEVKEKENEDLKAEVKILKEELGKKTAEKENESAKYAEEKMGYQLLISKMKLEFDNAARTVELLTDDKHRLISLMETKASKKKKKTAA